MTGKTGTLTEGEMSIGSLFLGSHMQLNIDTLAHEDGDINPDLRETFYQCLILNTVARMEVDDDAAVFVPQGSPVEVGLLYFLIDKDVPV